jgi:hypothetical protein
MLFISFLKENNPHIDDKALAKQATMQGGRNQESRLGDSPRGQGQLRANSTSGIVKGNDKISR